MVSKELMASEYRIIHPTNTQLTKDETIIKGHFWIPESRSNMLNAAPEL